MNVCVLWKDGGSWHVAEPTVSVLVYGDGSARVYDIKADGYYIAIGA